MADKLASFNGNDPASSDSISSCENSLGVTLPGDYVDFLRKHNGGEGYVGESYLILWSIEELVPFNREYEVSSYCPDLLIIASSGGGEAYGFDRRCSPWRVIQVPFVGMSYDLYEDMGSSFVEFIQKLANEGVAT